MVVFKRRDEDVPEDIRSALDSSPVDKKPNTFSTELELRRYLGSVQSRIKKEISDDFKHAKLDEKDKQAVIDMTDNAYMIVRIYELVETHAFTWKWNNERQVWEKRGLSDEERLKVKTLARNAFDGLMTKITMTCIMNINKPDNDLVKLLANPNRDDDKTEKTIIEMADQIKDKKKKKEEAEDKN